jgi:hypothetical protein
LWNERFSQSRALQIKANICPGGSSRLMLNAIEQYHFYMYIKCPMLWIPQQTAKGASVVFYDYFAPHSMNIISCAESKSCTCFDVVPECVCRRCGRCKTGGFSTGRWWDKEDFCCCCCLWSRAGWQMLQGSGFRSPLSLRLGVSETQSPFCSLLSLGMANPPPQPDNDEVFLGKPPTAHVSLCCVFPATNPTRATRPTDPGSLWWICSLVKFRALWETMRNC